MRAQRARNPLVLYMIPPRLGARPAWPRRPKFNVPFDLNLKAASSPPSSAVWSPPSFTLPVPFHTVPCQSLLRLPVSTFLFLPPNTAVVRAGPPFPPRGFTNLPFPLSLSSSTASFTLLPPQLPAPPPSSSLAPPPLLSLSPPRAELQRRGRTGCSAQLGSGGARGRPRHPPGHSAARPSSLSPRRAAGLRELGSIPPHRALAGHGGKAVPLPAPSLSPVAGHCRTAQGEAGVLLPPNTAVARGAMAVDGQICTAATLQGPAAAGSARVWRRSELRGRSSAARQVELAGHVRRPRGHDGRLQPPHAPRRCCSPE